MSYLTRLETRPVFEGVELDLYRIDEMVWITAEHLDMALKRESSDLERRLGAPLTGWQTRREHLSVWSYRWHREERRLRRLYSVEGAILLCTVMAGDPRADAFALWLPQLRTLT